MYWQSKMYFRYNRELLAISFFFVITKYALICFSLIKLLKIFTGDLISSKNLNATLSYLKLLYSSIPCLLFGSNLQKRDGLFLRLPARVKSWLLLWYLLRYRFSVELRVKLLGIGLFLSFCFINYEGYYKYIFNIILQKRFSFQEKNW